MMYCRPICIHYGEASICAQSGVLGIGLKDRNGLSLQIQVQYLSQGSTSGNTVKFKTELLTFVKVGQFVKHNLKTHGSILLDLQQS